MLWCQDLGIFPESAGPSRPQKIFTFELHRADKTRYEDDLRIHEETFVAHECLRMPPRECPLTKDPRDFPFGDMFRDAVHKALKFETLRLDFLWITVSLKPVRRLYDFRDEYLHVPWVEFIAELDLSTETII